MNILTSPFLIFILLILPTAYITSQEISLPNCNNAKEIKFDLSEIVKFDNRFLFEESTDTLESLYCFAKRSGNKELEAICLFKFASQYHELFNKTENFVTALSYLDACIELSNKYHLNTPLFWAKEKKATIFTTNKMYDQASVFAEQLIDLAIEMDHPERLAESYMILGRLRREQKKYSEAESLLKKSLSHQADNKSSHRIAAYTYLHLSNLKRLESQYNKSIGYAEQGLEHAKKIQSPKSGAPTYLAMEIILSNIELGNYEKANETIQLITQDIRHTKWVQVQKRIINALLYERSNQIEKAISEYNQAKKISTESEFGFLTLQVSDSLISIYNRNNLIPPQITTLFHDMSYAYQDLVNQSSQGNLFKNTYLKLENEKKNSNLLKSNLKKSRQLLILFISVIIFLIIIGGLIYRQNKVIQTYYQKIKLLNKLLKKNNVDLKDSNEKIRVHKDQLSLELKQQLLFLANQNNMINKLKKYVESNPEIDKKYKSKISSIMNLDRNNEIIENINVKFLELNGNILNKLSADFPHLTSNDLKLCLYLSLNMSSKEIAQIQYKTPESIKVARSRLRKKLNINNQSLKLSAFINGYNN